MKSRPVVKVEWIDAEQDPRWLGMSDIEKMEAPVATSYGVIVRRDKKVLVLAHSFIGEQMSSLLIPAGMIKRVTKL
jgi:hypothetical protein